MAEVAYCHRCGLSTGLTPTHVCSTFPIIIFQDRYTGAYSGGEWIAVAGATRVDWEGSEGVMRFDHVYDNAFDGDPDAANFWNDNQPVWVAVGNTPQEALDNLNAKLNNA